MASFEIGSDTAWFEARRLVIDAARDMPDWEVRQHRKPQIRFRSHVYFPVERVEGKWGRVRFVLEPWPEGSTDVPGPRIDYDESYVLERDGTARRSLAGAGLGPLLYLTFPLLGLLPSAIKEQLEQRFGLPQGTVTYVSILFEGTFALVLFVAWGISGWANMITALAPGGGPAVGSLQCTIFGFAILIGTDWAFRWGAHFRGGETSPGFYEWLWGPLLKSLLDRRGGGSSR
jgi:hypothetical protein